MLHEKKNVSKTANVIKTGGKLQWISKYRTCLKPINVGSIRSWQGSSKSR